MDFPHGRRVSKRKMCSSSSNNKEQEGKSKKWKGLRVRGVKGGELWKNERKFGKDSLFCVCLYLCCCCCCVSGIWSSITPDCTQTPKLSSTIFFCSFILLLLLSFLCYLFLLLFFIYFPQTYFCAPTTTKSPPNSFGDMFEPMEDEPSTKKSQIKKKEFRMRENSGKWDSKRIQQVLFLFRHKNPAKKSFLFRNKKKFVS